MFTNKLLLRSAATSISALGLAFILANTAQAQIVVNGSGDAISNDGSCTLREAIEAVNTNAAVNECTAPAFPTATITFSVSSVTLSTVGIGEDGNATGDLDINPHPAISVLTIDGGASGVTIDAGTIGDRVFDFVDSPNAFRLTFSNITVTNGTISVADTNRTTCRAGSGGAMRIAQGASTPSLDLALITVTLHTNQAEVNGGGACVAATGLLVQGSVITNNVVSNLNSIPLAGGGLYAQVSGDISITNTRVASNAVLAPSNAFYGGAYLSGGAVDVSNSVFSGNQASATGSSGSANTGGLYASGSSTGVRITNTQVMSNAVSAASNASVGGANLIGSVIDVSNSVFSHNQASATDSFGFANIGGLNAFGSQVRITNTQVTSNVASAASNAVYGGAYLNGGAVDVSDSTFSGNQVSATGSFGFANTGGLYASAFGAGVRITNTQVMSNAVSAASNVSVGGASLSGSSVDVSNSVFSGNQASATDSFGFANIGGLNAFGSQVRITNTQVTSNVASAAANALYGGANLNGGAVDVSDSTFSGNQALATGSFGFANTGGLHASAFGAGVRITNTQVTSNVASAASDAVYGGANLSGSSVDVSNSTFSGNQALATNPSGSASAGGLSASTTFGAVARITDTQVLSNSVVAGSTARGGGAYFLGNAHLHNVLIASNTITSGDDALGAGFYARNTNITITHSLVRGNLASGPSGGSVSGGAGFAENTNPSVVVTLTVYTSTFAENVAADAGGLATNGSKVNAIIMGSSVVSNTGYGVIFESAGAINHVQNTTIGANEDGLLNRKGTTLITHTTVASNTGVGLQRVPGSSIVVSATLVANNAPNCFGSITALGVNVSSGGCPAFSVVHPSASQLLPLASQSGEPPSYRPLSINPAVNATSCAANVDQRGVSRPQGANCDAGAVEIETTDLQIGKTATPAAVLSNGVVTYSLTVTNNGSTTATHVVVTDVVSSGAFGGLVTGTSGVSATVSGNLITFTLPNMSVGAVVTIVYTVTAPVQGVMTNTAQALALGNTDIAPGDNVMSTTVTITPVYALQLDKIQQYTVLTNVLSHTVAPGQMLTYVLVLTNTGPASAVNVALTDTLPSGVSVVGVASTPGLSCAQGVGQVTCSAASLITGTHAVTITVTAPMTSGVTLLNSAVASAAHAASVNDTTSVLVQYRALLPIVRKEP